MREFNEFFFSKGNALNLAIAVVVGTQFQQIVNAISKDLLMPLLNPLVRGGTWQNLAIPYFDGELAIGQILDVVINSLIVAWALFLIIKVINRSEKLASSTIDKVRGQQSAERENL
ncbi:large conductance mechanosensitive channel protein MscL [Synechococcus sp. MIT S9508]|uniref:large conductance mechanosensitive channel protein MscL n=1 Tax=Synechococcus sp. MIT S9508 TaxID=1801629 RepID=UPI0012E73A42|nr:large conductance mechanosensitive channel protein MscL [Synechococcus sp. MIT S9508]